jgi:hypothetical protein
MVVRRVVYSSFLTSTYPQSESCKFELAHGAPPEGDLAHHVEAESCCNGEYHDPLVHDFVPHVLYRGKRQLSRYAAFRLSSKSAGLLRPSWLHLGAQC